MNAPAISELRDEVILEQQIRSPAPGGGAVLTWQPIGPLWARITPMSGRETVIADRIVSQVTHEIWIRHRSGTTAAMRLRQGARVFDILAVLGEGARGQWMRCLCREQAL